MTTARELERHLVSAGFTASKLDIVTRALRDSKRIPQAGRGLYAARLNPRAAAAIIVAYLGTSKAVNAASRLAKLETARSADGDMLLDVVTHLLDEPIPFCELRISRVGRRARLLMPDGSTVWFTKTGAPPTSDHIEVEGVITASIVKNVIIFMTGGTPEVPPLDEPNDAE